MCSEPAGGGSNGRQGAEQARSDGFPLGLQTPLQMVRRSFGEAPTSFVSTPSSITSESSSDLDTESTGSFFAEKSTTLGSLIGIQSNSRREQSQALVPGHSMHMESHQQRKKSGSAGMSTATASSSSSLRCRAAWCPMFGCGRGSSRVALGMSPSLAHLLEEERKATEYGREAAVLSRSNTLFDEEGILPPHPSGAPLKLILQHESPSTSYLSADWNVYNERHPHQGSRGGGGGAGEAASHAKISTFWPSFCGSLEVGST